MSDDLIDLFGPLTHDKDLEARDGYVTRAVRFIDWVEGHPNTMWSYEANRLGVEWDEGKYTMTGAARFIGKKYPEAIVAWKASEKVLGNADE